MGNLEEGNSHLPSKTWRCPGGAFAQAISFLPDKKGSRFQIEGRLRAQAASRPSLRQREAEAEAARV